MAASYPASVKTFTAIVDGDTVQDEMWEECFDEVVAVQNALLNGFEHNLFPESTGDARTLGTTSKFWGLSYLKGIALTAASELTIATGAITATQGVHTIDTEADAATDDLDTITAGSGIVTGALLIVRAENVARVVTLKDGTGNLLLGGDFALSATDRQLFLIYDGTNWREIARSATSSSAFSESLNFDGAVAEVVNTTTETAVYSFSVPGGTLSTTRSIRLELVGDMLNDTGGVRTLTVRVKYGATTIASGAHAITQASTRGAQHVRTILAARGATNAQSAYTEWHSSMGATDNTAGAMVALSASTTVITVGAHVGVAEDSTAAKTFQVTVQWDLAHASASFRCQSAQLVVV